ncbi:MAG TPA: VanZ family protein [Burkholderiales bacterium]|nr:VanZ family protein [Burkholderiales bacterium]
MVLSVFVLSLIPVDVDLGKGSDKIEHFVAYAALSFWFGLLYTQQRRQLGFALGFILMGVVIEFLQGMTDYRDFEVADMVADAIGAAIGFALLQTPLKNALFWTEQFLARVARK